MSKRGNISNRLGEFLFAGRRMKEWSQRRLAAETGISDPAISQIETGHIREPSFRDVVRLCRALGLSLDRAAKYAMDEIPHTGSVEAPMNRTGCDCPSCQGMTKLS